MSARRLLLAMLLVCCAAATARADEEPFVREGGERGRRLHLQLRSTFLYSTFSPGLGGALRLSGQLPLWDRGRATGTLDVGLLLGYAYGGAFLYPWEQGYSDRQSSASDHNLRIAISAGHTFHVGQRRRAAFGLHLFAGLNVLHQRGTLAYLREGLSGEGSDTLVGLTWGPELDFHYRFSRRVDLNLVLGGAIPTDPVGGPPGALLHAGAGLTFYLR